MTETTLGLFTIFVLSVFVGFEVISKVSPILHTPLMSGANAIHGVILVGAIIVLGTGTGTVQTVLGFLAVVRREPPRHHRADLSAVRGELHRRPDGAVVAPVGSAGQSHRCRRHGRRG